MVALELIVDNIIIIISAYIQTNAAKLSGPRGITTDQNKTGKAT